jgi:pyruvate dehydrogenase E1 component
LSSKPAIHASEAQDNDEPAIEAQELDEWIESLRDISVRYGSREIGSLISRLQSEAARFGAPASGASMRSPYVNTIHHSEQPEYPGDQAVERRLRSTIRWNAMAMVVQANRQHDGIGGHISTFASAATLFEVGFNHFFRAPRNGHHGDIVYFQGHASPGVYARAFLEGRFDEGHLHRFRRETGGEPGLSSYPHPWLMPRFWLFPSVSMGLSSIMAIYQARFLHYLRDRGIADTSDMHVWCFIGDGECDEPETLGALSLASREKLDNLTFVVNCNLQRLDGPVRGNGKIIQELETVFAGAGWNTIKVIWGSPWDPLLDADDEGLLVQRMNETVDGEYQKYSVESGAFIRKRFFGTSDRLLQMVEHLSDRDLENLSRGGHDPQKVYAAYRAALAHRGAPSVILAKTVKGYGLGEAGEGRNITHQQKKLNEEELRHFRSRFDVPIEDEDVGSAPFYRPADDAEQIRYLRERRDALGGPFPQRIESAASLEAPAADVFDEFFAGSGDREVATTMAFVRMLGRLLRDEKVGDRLVPIVPDEARTFGLDALFRRHGIYSRVGQLYEPVDQGALLSYREAKDGKILEEGITEAGSLCSLIAAGTSYATLGIQMVPFFVFYSMFGFQRIGDLIWAAADARARGFLLGATAGRTTLAGEGLQHQDGHSHLVASHVPNIVAYDPAYAYELAVIVRDGFRRMFQEQEALLYYITLYNEKYPMPEMPQGSEEGIIRGMYRLSSRDIEDRTRVQLLGSGPLVREALRAQEILAEQFNIASDVWSVTSFSELRRDALHIERYNRLHPDEERKQSFVEKALANSAGPFIAATDYVRLVSEQIARFLPGRLVALGTDGFGRSDTREALRRHFEIDAEHIVLAALDALCEDGVIERENLRRAIESFEIEAERPDPATAGGSDLGKVTGDHGD